MSFAVASNGASVNTAVGPDQLLSITNPFTKLDTTNIVSFQTIQLLFDHEPPQPPSGAPYYTNTLVYQFAHGYNYVPSIWLEWQNKVVEIPTSPSSGNSATTYYPFGDDTAGYAAYDAIVNGNIELEGVPWVATVEYNDSGSVSNTTAALLYARVEGPNVYIYLMKQTFETIGGNVIPLYLEGVILNLRVYVFTEPGTTSTY